MKRILAFCLAAALLFGCMACGGGTSGASAGANAPATEQAVSAAAPSLNLEELDARHGFTEEGAATRRIDNDYGDYQVRSLVCLDGDGYVTAVKERYVFPEDKDGEAAYQRLARPEAGTYTAEGNYVYFTWDPATVAEQFGSLYPDEIQNALATWEQEGEGTEPEVTEVAVNAEMLKKDGLTLALTNVRYAMGSRIEFDLLAENGGKNEIGYYLLETYLNGWLVDTDHPDVTMLAANESKTHTIAVRNMNASAFQSMNIGAVQTLQLNVRLYRTGMRDAGYAYTAVAVNPECPADYVQSYDDSGTVLLDDDAAKVVQRRFDGRSRRAQIYFEKKDASKWTSVSINPVFNGYGAFRSNVYNLQKGIHAVIDLDGTEVCEQYGFDAVSKIDVYLTYYHKDKLKDPIHLTLVNPKGGGESSARPATAYPTVFAGKYCTIRFAGVSSAYFTDTDVLLLECENTSDKYLSVYQAYNYMLLDGSRVTAWMSNPNVYPHSVTTMALYPDDYAFADLSRYKTAETSLGVYEIRSGYHFLLENAGKVTLPLP